MLLRPSKDSQKSFIFSKIIRLAAEEFTEPRHDLTLWVFDDGAIARWPGISPRSAIAMSGVPTIRFAVRGFYP
jgi:hypothetical protein